MKIGLIRKDTKVLPSLRRILDEQVLKFALSNGNHQVASEYAMKIEKLVPRLKDKSIRDLLTKLVEYFNDENAFFHLDYFKDGYIAQSENTIYHARNK